MRFQPYNRELGSQGGMKIVPKQPTRPVIVIGTGARDFPYYLSEALNACLNLGMAPVMVENAASLSRDAIEASLSLIDKADFYIGILGHRYGYVPPGCNKSIDEMEYERVLRRNIPRIIFVALRGQTIDPTLEYSNARLDAFMQLIRAQEAVYALGSPAEFRANLTGNLSGIKKSSKTSAVKPIRFGQGKKGAADGQIKDVGPKLKPIYKQTVRVFVASPKDVQDERSRMPKVIDSINKTLGKLFPVTVELWRWEVNATPAVGEPQALVNLELDKSDVVVVIFWNRFGTPTPTGITGTQTEVLRSLKRWNKTRRPQVMIYFCQRAALLDGPELQQRLNLLDFRKRLSSLVLSIDYEEAQEFEWRVRDDLFLTISSLYVKHS